VKFFQSLRKYLPTPKEIQQYRYLHIFGDSLKQPELWTFNRQSTAKGVAIGLFCAFLPIPFEIIPAIFIAAMLRGNLPFAVAGIWISNPLTWVPLYTPCYLLGAWLIGIQPHFLISFLWRSQVRQRWKRRRLLRLKRRKSEENTHS